MSARQGVPLHIHKYVTWPVIAPDITPPTQINRKYKKNTTIFTSCGCGRCHDYNKEIGEYVTSWPVAALSFMDGGPPVDNRVTKLRLNLTVEPQDIYPCISLLIYENRSLQLCINFVRQKWEEKGLCCSSSDFLYDILRDSGIWVVFCGLPNATAIAVAHRMFNKHTFEQMEAKRHSY